MKFEEINTEILYTREAITKVDREDINMLKDRALRNDRKRARLCCHTDSGDPLHEMLIVLAKGAYFRPHKHIQKSESFHIIDGELKVVIFDEDGKVTEVIGMGDYTSKEKFYYRLSESCFHTVIPVSYLVVFHETTNGPFRREDIVFAPWAPADDEEDKQADYLNSLTAHLGGGGGVIK